MKSESLHQLKQELKNSSREDLVELCIRMAKYKVENKELLSYLLFDAENEDTLINNIKDEITIMFDEINDLNAYYIKKSLRKQLRIITKYVKFSKSKKVETELLIHFLSLMKERGWQTLSPVLQNIYERQLIKIEKSISGMHEDLRFDYLRILEML